ncbi:proline-rich receptor-like protein kinase PERK10 [Homarus americanus]|nr:proline-rich receptor-like protein kinase PERK10 [Homarus americanus]
MSKITKRFLVKEEGSLTLDTDGEKLKHVTQLRPKGPSRRRPPSGMFKENMKNQITADSDSSPLPPTPEDEVDHDTVPQANGHLGATELSRSPIAPVLSPTGSKASPELRSRPEPLPRPDSTNSVPWLQELRYNQKQKKRLSGILLPDNEATPAPAPAVSSKPTMLPQKAEEKPAAKIPKATLILPDNPATASKTKSSDTPHLPTPDYEHKNVASQLPKSKTKPLPVMPPVTMATESKKSVTPTDVRTSVSSVDNKKPYHSSPDTKDNKKTVTDGSATGRLEEKIDALYKDLLPKVKTLEDRLEEQRKEQARRMQLLMNELDEERKKRACMEVEIERLRKLVDAYAQV